MISGLLVVGGFVMCHKKLLQIKQSIHPEVEKKLNDLSEKDKLILTKGLTKNLINKYNIPNLLVVPLTFIHEHLKNVRRKY